MQALNGAALPGLRTAIGTGAVPHYARATASPGVVHLGLGAFHRAHQAMVFESLLQQGDLRWGVLGAAMRSTELAQALHRQEGLYAVQVASQAGRHWQVIGAVLETCVAALEPARVVAALAAPATRWVTLTVTEKGYGPELAALLVQGLAERRRAGLGGLTVASCDNLSGNGRQLQQLCLTWARDPQSLSAAGLADWIARECAFPNSMVDRIVPAATAQCRSDAALALGVEDHCALATEGFWEWVIERRFVDDADAMVLSGAGVTVVDEVKPFEEAKLRMLNGSHTAMACIGAVAGLPTVADVIAHPAVAGFVHRLMTLEVAPHLRRPALGAYRDALLARFANPDLKHSVHQIASDSSQKIPQRWLASVQAQRDLGGSVEHLAFAAAAWMRYQDGQDDQGQRHPVVDPLASQTQALALQYRGNAAATVAALLGLSSIWGQRLGSDPVWSARVSFWLAHIQRQGVLGALTEFNQITGRH